MADNAENISQINYTLSLTEHFKPAEINLWSVEPWGPWLALRGYTSKFPLLWQKMKAVRIRTIKTYGQSSGTAPLIVNLSTI
jgi:hypothetical protein